MVSWVHNRSVMQGCDPLLLLLPGVWLSAESESALSGPESLIGGMVGGLLALMLIPVLLGHGAE